MSDLNYAIIGTGMMGQEHIKNIRLLENARIAAIADPDDGMRAAAQALAGEATRAYADYRAMMAAEDLDAVVIASPNHTHAALLAELALTDLPILVEKPLCTTNEDCQAVQGRFKKRAAPLWVAMEYRYMPAIARLIDEVGKGSIGRLKSLSIREHRFPFLDKVGDWNRFNRNTGGTLVEKCCHFFDLMRLIIGREPVRIYASGAQDVNHLDECHGGEVPDIIDNALVIVDFAGGGRAMLELCMFAEGSYFQEQICAIGDKAKIEALIPGPARFWPGGKERQSEVVISNRAVQAPERIIIPVEETILSAGDHHGATYFQHLEFNAMIRNGCAPVVSLADGLAAVAMGIAAQQSIQDRRVIALDPIV